VTPTVLLVCRANLCRSPSAEVMLARALATTRTDVAVASAGLQVRDDQVAPEDFVELALLRGIDLRAHRPVPFTPELGRTADLILTMTRELLRTMVVETPEVWPRSFTLLELCRRAATTAPPEPGQTLATWVQKAHRSRDRAELLSLDEVDDLRDPMVAREEPESSDAVSPNEEMFGELERATRRLARLLTMLSGEAARVPGEVTG
jgi:protein-tyrosine phosphatase